MDLNGKVGIIGGGSWATALAKLFLNNLKQINWYVRNTDHIIFLQKYGRNPKYLSDVEFDPGQVHFSDDINEIIGRSEILIFAIPSAFLKESLEKLNVSLKNKFVVSAIKGIIPHDNLTIAEFFNKYHEVPFSKVGIITGPCHAEEVALERLSYLTIASKSPQTGEALSGMLACRYIKTIPTNDIYGTEYAGVLKNIFAIAAGISHGLGYGDNFIAVLVSNSIQEIKRFLDKTYKNKRKVFSSAYLGDLLVTAYSQFSRNRTFGMMIGKGYTVKSAQLEMNMIAEGYYATKCIKEINSKFMVKMPITDAVYNILYEKISPSIEMKILSDKLK